ncbi:MAG: hypothetical protein HY722_05020 [Planctomycetes bacterium]|nr:hypothetical protein [Planctomycetota bacterium]
MSQASYDEKVRALERRLSEMKTRIAELRASEEVRAIVDLEAPREAAPHGHAPAPGHGH